MHGSSSGLDESACTRGAMAEGLERYSVSMYHSDEFVRASAIELGRDSMDLDLVARCSARELAHPRCPLRLADPHAPIRWVRALSLLDGRTVFVPAVMTFLYAGYESGPERFWLPLSTGCAAHTSYERALLSAILEVVERDAVSVVWLQKLELPKIEIDSTSPVLEPYLEAYERASCNIEYTFFDATSDLGIPTVYGLQHVRTDPRVTTIVACASDCDPAAAVAKVIRDMASARVTFRSARSFPDDWDDFGDVFHGATYMARAEQAHAFAFLLDSRCIRPLSRIARIDTDDDTRALRAVLERLRQHKLDAYAVDVSTDEALRCGMRVVRVIVPGLQPLSFHYRARYLGHPRLYDMPAAMGHRVRQEAQLNHWPQPFN